MRGWLFRGVAVFLFFNWAHGEILYRQIQSLGFIGSEGISPQARLLVGPDGRLYGTTYLEGNHGGGTIFAIQPDGSQFTTLHHFGAAENDGARPYAVLTLGRDGAIYGTTERGGITNGGIIFKIRPDGSGYQVLYQLMPESGYAPRGHLVDGPDGYLYGTTQFGGYEDGGTVFKIRPDGSRFTVLHLFDVPGAVGPDGRDCDTGLTLGSDGLLYGVASFGGAFSGGTIFRLAVDGSGYTNLHHFDRTNGWEADGQLLELPDGMLYGTTQYSGEGFASLGSRSTIYRINKDGTDFQVLKFMNRTNGEPDIFYVGLTLARDGALYGSLQDGVIKIRPDGSGFEVLHRFPSSSLVDGYNGWGLVQGVDGALYGATRDGGTYGRGTVFKINTDGSDYSILHHFHRQTNFVALPRASLVSAGSGVFVGTSEGGGAANAGTIFSLRANGSDDRLLFSFGRDANGVPAPNALANGSNGLLYGTTLRGGNIGAGTIFRIDQNGSNYSVIHHLGAAGEPRSPRGGLIDTGDGWLYGTTANGGSSNRGTIYKLNKDTGDLVLLHSFSGEDGQQPQCELVQTVAGTLYGTSSLGGAQNFGTIYSIQPDGTGFAILHNFTGGSEGQNPTSGLMIASDGKLYGTTARRVISSAGCLYRLNIDGSGFQALKSFPATGSGPKVPKPPLVEASDGMLYGAAQFGGAADKGAIFRISKEGDRFETLHEFGLAATDGQIPSAAFTPVGDGSFLGVTEAGGRGNGTIFRFDPTDVRLRIFLTQGTAELRWASSSTVDTLERSTSLNGYDWEPIGVPVTESGGENQASVPRDSGTQFFRVVRIWP